MPKPTKLPKGLVKVEPLPAGDRLVEIECVQLTLATKEYPPEAIRPWARLLLTMAKREMARAKARPDYFLKGHGADASGHLVPEGFILHEGSRLAKNCAKALSSVARELRTELEKKSVIALEGDELVLQRECTFESASLAAAVVLGRPPKGSNVWKDNKDRTIEENRPGAGRDSASEPGATNP